MQRGLAAWQGNRDANRRMEQLIERTTRAALQYLAATGRARELETDRFVKA